MLTAVGPRPLRLRPDVLLSGWGRAALGVPTLRARAVFSVESCTADADNKCIYLLTFVKMHVL